VKIWYCSIQARTSGEGAKVLWCFCFFASVEGAGSRAMIRLSIGNQLQDGQGRTSNLSAPAEAIASLSPTLRWLLALAAEE
jgi:hypothetical protein